MAENDVKLSRIFNVLACAQRHRAIATLAPRSCRSCTREKQRCHRTRAQRLARSPVVTELSTGAIFAQSAHMFGWDFSERVSSANNIRTCARGPSIDGVCNRTNSLGPLHHNSGTAKSCARVHSNNGVCIQNEFPGIRTS